MNRHEPPAPPAPPDARVTPMMEQYIEIRAANPDCLLFYRMGDFYELFFDDAAVAARALGIALTKRGKHLGEDIPMCGVPVHAADDYLQRLIAQGHRVAVCEQTEDPAEARRRGSKSVVRRAVTRLVTPGTLTEDSLLETGRANFLAAIAAPAREKGAGRAGPGSTAGPGPTSRAAPASGPGPTVGDGPRIGPGPTFGVAWADISTGEFRLAETSAADLGALLARIEPREILLPEALAGDPALRENFGLQADVAMTPLPPAFFDAAGAPARLAAAFGVATMEAFGAFSAAELAAGAALLAYAEKTQVAARPRLEPPKRVAEGEAMRIDAATRANLELFRTLSGERAGSLLAAIDRTVTAAGARLLAERLASPLRDPAAIAARLDQVECLVDDAGRRAALRDRLRTAPDMLRALSRLALGRGGPRDLGAVRAGLEAAAAVARELDPSRGSPSSLSPALSPLAPGDPGGGSQESREIAVFADCLRMTDQVPSHVVAGLNAALADELPLNRRDGAFIRAGHCGELDAARALRDESRRVVAALQATYAEATGIRALKIRHNNVLGYFVEVNAVQGQALAAKAASGEGGGEGGAEGAPTFVHRQTMANAMRFSTAELADLEARIAAAADTAQALEEAHFDRLSAMVLDAAEEIRAAAQALAIVDVSASHAELAAAGGQVRPRVDASLSFAVSGGRHPVVEAALRRDGKSFVGNDCDLGDPSGGKDESGGRVWLLTGPNMAGKSTFLRQNALIAILAQAGAFVPARSAHIGVVDALFSRVGAADDLARGRSTFMVEMVETAAILNQAGPHSLVILDEIGRGTATFDGLSIAWAVIEHLHAENRCRALFATHYHELTALSARLPRLVAVTMKVTEWRGEVVFLHEVVPGAADRSYGIQVAKLAGLPAAVIARARAVLTMLEKGERRRPAALIDELPLFAAAAAETETGSQPPPTHPAVEALAELDPDDLTPREALDALYRLKRLETDE